MVVKRVMRLERKAENPGRYRERQMLNPVYRKPLGGELVDRRQECRGARP
jgi:hypothetical protein